MAFLLEPEPRGKVELSEITASFAHIVAITSRPVDRAEMARRAVEKGIEEEDVDDLVGQLLDGGVLRKV